MVGEACLISLIILSFVIFIATLVANGLATSGAATGLFLNTTGNISAGYKSAITPSSWAFSILPLIYTWQLIWLLYAMSTVFRRCVGRRLCSHPGHLHPMMFVMFCLNLLCNNCWLFLWDSQYIVYALIVLMAGAVAILIATVSAHILLHVMTPTMVEELLSTRDIWCTRLFVHNGLSLYASWNIIAALLNLDVLLSNIADLPVETSAAIVLSLLMLIVVMVFVLDVFVLDALTRYTFTHNLPIIVAVSASIDNNWRSGSSTSALLVIVLVVGCIAFTGKIITGLYRHCRRPFCDSFYTVKKSYGLLAERNTRISTF